MSSDAGVRCGWLKFMYAYTIVWAGGFGLGILIVPETLKRVFQWPGHEPIALSIVGSVYAAFGLVSVFGLRHPIRFAPILLLQLCYKVIWFVGAVVPLLISERFPSYALLTAAVFATYIVGDLIAIPFRYVLGRESAK